MKSIKQLNDEYMKNKRPLFFKKGKMKGSFKPEQFDKDFHSDHSELNNILKEAGIKDIRFKKVR